MNGHAHISFTRVAKTRAFKQEMYIAQCANGEIIVQHHLPLGLLPKIKVIVVMDLDLTSLPHHHMGLDLPQHHMDQDTMNLTATNKQLPTLIATHNQFPTLTATHNQFLTLTATNKKFPGIQDLQIQGIQPQ
jgi:hypothetical protein